MRKMIVIKIATYIICMEAMRQMIVIKNSNVYNMYRRLDISMFIYIFYLPNDNNILTMQNHNIFTDIN